MAAPGQMPPSIQPITSGPPPLPYRPATPLADRPAWPPTEGITAAPGVADADAEKPKDKWGDFGNRLTAMSGQMNPQPNFAPMEMRQGEDAEAAHQRDLEMLRRRGIGIGY